MVFSDTYFQPDKPDPVLAEAVVVKAARRHAPWVGPLIEVDESGGEARAYVMEGGVVVKTQRPHRLRARTSLAKEALFLAELDRQGEFPVPKVLGHGDTDGIEYLCLTRTGGSALERRPIGPEGRAVALNELGRLLRRIHSIDQSVLHSSGLVPGDRAPADLRSRLAEMFTRLADALEGDGRFSQVTDIRELASRRLATTPENVRPVALHSNPGPEHTFVDPVSGTFIGLIDFGDAYRSHPALDLRPWTDERDADALFAGYLSAGPPLPEFEEVRLTVRIIAELAMAARGYRAPEELAGSLNRLLG
jgi:aminoglycoside phosphotransferase (APT) family kinase protein